MTTYCCEECYENDWLERMRLESELNDAADDYLAGDYVPFSAEMRELIIATAMARLEAEAQ